MKQNMPVVFPDNKTIMKQLKYVFKTSECVFFHGCYHIPLDPLTSEKSYIKVAAHDVWKAMGYCFQ